jgi:hypothetical protein
LWKIDACISYKYPKLRELIRATFLWIIWNEINRLIFKGGNGKSIRCLGGSIIALAKYWCSIKDYDYQNSLHFILPSNINLLLVQIIEVLLEIELLEAVV